MEINKDYAILGLLGIILVMSGIFIFAFQDSNQCIGNPLTYGANKLSTPETGEFMCSCFFTNPKYGSLIFDKNNVTRNP